MPKKREVIDSSKDKMAECLVFVINNFPNKMIVDKDMKPTTWHGWFKEVLENAGYKIITTPKKEK